ncbi:fibronectin type III domain-containing protein [Jatrophihabitans sp.]|uniref:fibronectin type III domain-containing protein n=1 Tax=Jatrophihabitans sp. TaxID=1932789 RepID=UPI0030C6AE88|nr:hypothetical protein [Jatrophihabitans sp.]
MRRPNRPAGSPSPFRPSGPDQRSPGRSHRLALLVGFVVCITAVAVASVVVKPTTARAFHLLYGSTFIDDDTAPVAIDLASGRPTVRLRNAIQAVSATSTGDLDVLALGSATLMLNSRTGEFNMLDASGLLLKQTGGGVRLPASSSGSASAVPSGEDAFILRSGASATEVYLVSQSTVASAARPGSHTLPRASTTLPAALATGRGSAAAAAGGLWVLTGTGPERALRELTVPRASNAGAALDVASRGIVTGASAIEATTDSKGGGLIALASAGGLRLFSSDGTVRTLHVKTPAGLDQVLPVSGLAGRAAFLLHSPAGWSLLSAVSTRGAAVMRSIDALPADVTLVNPAGSGASIFTMQADGAGRLWQISRSGVAGTIPGAARYPVLHGEKLDLTGAEIRSAGTRVIFDARADYEAEVVFTDGSHAPLTVDKHSAVQLDPSGTQALVVSHQAGGTKAPSKSPKPAKTRPRPAAPAVNDKIDCSTTTQTPHIPAVHLVERGSRSVQLAWTYPLLDTQDCVPSTYTVTTVALSSGAPHAPGMVTVQGQTGINLSGLYPDTDYRLVVTAYLNGRGTASLPIEVRTSVEGPAAPTNVTTTVDAAGNWVLTWQSCGGVSAGCVASTTWQVIPRFCDGVGLGGAPQTRLLVGDPTQHSFSFTYTGDPSLLGRGLSFQVAGVGDTGVIGSPAGDGTCSYSWTPPVASDISLAASAPPIVDGGASTETTVTAHFSGGQTHDLGGVGGELTYQLLSAGVVIDSTGPTTSSSVTLAGIHPGAHYQVRLVASPARHADAAVLIGPVDVQPALALWPQPTVTAGFTATSASTGALVVTVTLPLGTDTHGETFDLAGASLDCGNAHLELDRSGIRSGQPLTFDGLSRATYNSQGSPCSVTAALAQDAATALSPPLYGAGDSPAATSGPVAIPVPVVDTTAGDFSASWVGDAAPGAPQIAVSYTGSSSLIGTYGQGWTISAATDSTASCGSTSSSPTGSPAVIDVTPSCVSADAIWKVSVAFTYFGQSASYSIDVSGTKPAPVDPSQLSFTASWTPDSTAADAQVQIAYSGPYDDATLSSLDWTIAITSSGTAAVSCGTSTSAPRADGSGPRVGVDLTACPTTTGTDVATYTVKLAFTDPNYGSTGSYEVTVTGAVPQ